MSLNPAQEAEYLLIKQAMEVLDEHKIKSKGPGYYVLLSQVVYGLRTRGDDSSTTPDELTDPVTGLIKSDVAEVKPKKEKKSKPKEEKKTE